jgi:hypothetical protein
MSGHVPKADTQKLLCNCQGKPLVWKKQLPWQWQLQGNALVWQQQSMSMVWYWQVAGLGGGTNNV